MQRRHQELRAELSNLTASGRGAGGDVSAGRARHNANNNNNNKKADGGDTNNNDDNDERGAAAREKMATTLKAALGYTDEFQYR